jgi:hypothetical protein
MSRWAGVPGSRGDPGGFSQHVVAAVGDLAQLVDRFVEVAAFGGVPRCGAVKGAVEESIRGWTCSRVSNVCSMG